MTVRFLRRTLAFFLPVAACLTVMAALVYAAVQHEYRTSANDPQLQIATDAAHRLDAGIAPKSVVGGPIVDLATNLGTHISVYTRSGRVLISTARLAGASIAPPRGVLDTAVRQGKNIVTWQPQSGIRIAAVVVPWHGGTVLAGRSLAPVEDRETDLMKVVVTVWVGGLIVLLITALLAALLWPSIRPQESDLYNRQKVS